MYVAGPYITKTVHVPAHNEQVFDESAYWQLNHQGEPDNDGGFYYAKVAWPSLAAAQHQHQTERLAHQAERAEARRKNKTPAQHDRALRAETARRHRG